MQGKTKRLKQAKDEAMKEIEAYKAEREGAYKNLEQQVNKLAIKAPGFLLIPVLKSIRIH